MAITDFTIDVDASGLHCPLPLLRLKKAIKEIESGEVVRVIATDPAAHLDFGVYIEQVGHEMLDIVDEQDRKLFYVRKK